MRCIFKLTCALALCLVLLAQPAPAQTPDPLEGINRKIYAFNKGLDTLILKPLAQGYTFITPGFVRNGIGNFFDNLFYPATIVNQALQGKLKLAGQDTARFLLNSTMGLAGLIDVATTGGLPKHQEDFGQTFATWGIGSGPYLVVPLWGPSTMRSGVGDIAGIFTNPLTYIEDDETKYGLLALSVIDKRARLLKAEELISGDEYLFVRDAYLQRREHLIRDGKAEENDPFLDGE